MLAAGASVSPVWSGELQLGPDDLTPADVVPWEADMLARAATTTAGTVAYSPHEGAYVVTLPGGTTSLSFGPKTTIERLDPAFVVDGFSATTWHVTFQGQEVASSAAPVGSRAVAAQSGSEIVIALFATIPSGAADTDRLLTLSSP